jgi:hypothetical protein
MLELARAGRSPDSGVTVAELLDAYVPVAGWDVSTEEANLGYIRRTIKPALGVKEVRKVRGPLLDNLYAAGPPQWQCRIPARYTTPPTACPAPASRTGCPAVTRH